MQKIRVLIVDDSAVVRRLLTNALSVDSDIEVVGVAANGKIALSKIPQLQPDLITLDIEMPEMDGLETLVAIRKIHPKLPVIMFSTLTERGAVATLDALARGASDYVAKPSNTGSIELSIKKVQEELIPKIRVFCHRAENCLIAKPTLAAASSRQPGGLLNTMTPNKPAGQLNPQRTAPTQRIDAVVIGTSTGGPNALTRVLPNLSADLQVPIFIVQHMPPIFTARLAERLDQLSAISVVEAADNMKVEPGRAYLAPGDFHLKLTRRGSDVQTILSQEAPECSCRPAVDVLFRSAASLYGANILAVILTGMGQDGLVGCQLIRNQGGQVIAQDEASSVVWGMPGAITKAGLAHEVLPLDAVARAIQLQVCRGRNSNSTRLAGAAPS